MLALSILLYLGCTLVSGKNVVGLLQQFLPFCGVLNMDLTRQAENIFSLYNTTRICNKTGSIGISEIVGNIDHKH